MATEARSIHGSIFENKEVQGRSGEKKGRR
jgi:hypothetical protein